AQADGVRARIDPRGGATEMHEECSRVRGCDASGMLNHAINEIVADFGEVVRLPVVAPTERLAGIQHGLMLHERFQSDRVGERSPKGLERANRIVTVGRVPGPAHRDGGHRLTMYFLGQVSRGWSLAQD